MEAPHVNFRGQKMHSYFPATVSEMVHNTSSGAGKCFFAFCLIGGICMLMSWYPWQLRNVYVGDDLKVFGSWLGKTRGDKDVGPSLLMMRQFLPPVGIMLVACIPAPPAANREFTDTVSCVIHTVGATMSIGGYAFIELYTIFSKSTAVVFDEKRGEKQVRAVLIWSCLIAIVIFQLFGFLAGHADKLGICCEDVWQVPKPSDWQQVNADTEPGLRIEDEIAAAHSQKMLLRTASGTYLFLKFGEYMGEVFSGLFMLASHLAIWWYCPERHVDLDEKLPDPEGQHYERMSES